ncbi:MULTISPECIES: LysR family transcriptional regulator [unclassified Ruegeria]|uniref:LysR family transcriptional regulator n=1 Tax=unclassified Ruegeria TaxID=2625375 RepID=UPI0014915A22|nr:MULTISPECIES: LysR family transcriptional regulator [unclassified Ruegeria]NOD48890.1 LysR family transcriptional regulator [Ruegeria sp. HKCCD5849]NOD53537.1 LysR family transcriptional regulator [Ruegeria sp. HKCCD5851]NOD66235.1 LysR family transcriptional regulator [Ruegeria sp. HKCCD7303]
MNNENWDDIRYALAVSKYGSLNAAATAMGVTHATVLRRVAAFEERNGCRIFQKNPSGYSVLPEASAIFSAMESVEDAVLSVERAVVGANRSPMGHVRITSTDSLCQIVLPRILNEISRLYPGLNLTLLSQNSHHDLSRLTADIAVRPSIKLGEGLIGERAGTLSFGVFDDGSPNRRWMRLDGALSRSLPAKWLAQNVSADEMTNGADSFLVLQQMAASGAGKTFLPSFFGDVDTRLKRSQDVNPKIEVPLWVATLEEISQTPRFAVVQKALVERISEALAK